MAQNTPQTYVIGAEVEGKLKVLSYFMPDVPYVFTEIGEDRKLTKEFLKENEVYFCNNSERAEARLTDAKNDLVSRAVDSLKLTFDQVAAEFPHFSKMKIYGVDSDGNYSEFVKEVKKEKRPAAYSHRRL